MAHNKVGARGPSGSNHGMAGAMVPMEVALSGAIGARVRISTSPIVSTIEGTLFTADPITNLVAINTADPQSQAGDFRIIPVSRIQSFQILSLAPSSTSNPADGPSFADAVPPVHALDLRALKTREVNAVGKLQESEARRGKGVTREAQDLFDAFGRTMPTRWDGTNIVVADAVVIPAPYQVDNCRPLVEGDTAALARVRKVLEMERKKMEFRNASAQLGTTSTFSRGGSVKETSSASMGQRKGG